MLSKYILIQNFSQSIILEVWWSQRLNNTVVFRYYINIIKSFKMTLQICRSCNSLLNLHLYQNLKHNWCFFSCVLFSIQCVKIVRIWSFSSLHFPPFGLNIQAKCAKIWTRKTPNTDTFYTVNGGTKLMSSESAMREFPLKRLPTL